MRRDARRRDDPRGARELKISLESHRRPRLILQERLRLPPGSRLQGHDAPEILGTLSGKT